MILIVKTHQARALELCKSVCRHVDFAGCEDRIVRALRMLVRRRLRHGPFVLRLRVQTKHAGSESFVNGRRCGPELFEIRLRLCDDLGFMVRQEWRTQRKNIGDSRSITGAFLRRFHESNI